MRTKAKAHSPKDMPVSSTCVDRLSGVLCDCDAHAARMRLSERRTSAMLSIFLGKGGKNSAPRESTWTFFSSATKENMVKLRPRPHLPPPPPRRMVVDGKPCTNYDTTCQSGVRCPITLECVERKNVKRLEAGHCYDKVAIAQFLEGVVKMKDGHVDMNEVYVDEMHPGIPATPLPLDPFRNPLGHLDRDHANFRWRARRSEEERKRLVARYRELKSADAARMTRGRHPATSFNRWLRQGNKDSHLIAKDKSRWPELPHRK